MKVCSLELGPWKLDMIAKNQCTKDRKLKKFMWSNQTMSSLLYDLVTKQPGL